MKEEEGKNTHLDRPLRNRVGYSSIAPFFPLHLQLHTIAAPAAGGTPDSERSAAGHSDGLTVQHAHTAGSALEPDPGEKTRAESDLVVDAVDA